MLANMEMAPAMKMEAKSDAMASKEEVKMKSKDDEKAWKELVNLCKVLCTTPTDDLEKALEPILDIDNVLRFLAVDIALINDDGYWTRGSDYSLFRDAKGKFHVAPHDMNEAFVPGKGGMFGKGFGPPKDGKDFKDKKGFGEKKEFGEKKDGKDGPPIPGEAKGKQPFPGDGPMKFPFPGGGPGTFDDVIRMNCGRLLRTCCTMLDASDNGGV